jgi:hypothetical protein
MENIFFSREAEKRLIRLDNTHDSRALTACAINDLSLFSGSQRREGRCSVAIDFQVHFAINVPLGR